MQVFTKFEAFQKNPERLLVLTLGNFDGLHLGHQKILQRVVQSAKVLNAEPSVLTFQQHPQRILHPSSPPPHFVLSPEYKLLLLARAGIQNCFFIPFTENFSKIEAKSFVNDVLIKQLGMKKMCLGYNARFGYGRKGNPELMRELSGELGFEFEEVGPLEAENEAISSSRIRKLLQEGQLDQAAVCLGRPFSFLGKVVRGEGRGKQLGFPTANLDPSAEIFLPFGVYPVFVQEINTGKKNIAAGREEWRTAVSGHLREGVLNFGVRPTFKGGEARPVLEVFLLDFNGDLYGKTLEVFISPRLRPEQAFQGAEALKTQISRDIEAARAYFSSQDPRETAQISAFTKHMG